MKRLLSAFLLTVFALCVCPLGFAETDAPVKLILDCDMNYMNDDALALSLLLMAEEKGLVEILGITLVGGNTFIDLPYENFGTTQECSSKRLADLLAAAGRSDIPCYRGIDLPIGFDTGNLEVLGAFYKGIEYTVGNKEYGAIHFFTSVDSGLFSASDDAAEFLVSSVRENPGEVVIFAIGPAMNIARAVELDPEFAGNVKTIYFMGGALGDECVFELADGGSVSGIDGANVNSITEYNVIYDPAAFQICLTAGFTDMYIAPGSCNEHVNTAIAERFFSNAEGSAISALWAAHYNVFVQPYPYWDPLSVYAFLCPEAITSSAVEYVYIYTDRGDENFGRTVGYTAEEYSCLPDGERALCGRATVLYTLEGFWDFAIELMSR